MNWVWAYKLGVDLGKKSCGPRGVIERVDPRVRSRLQRSVTLG
jgi:hypothetical protein